MLFRSENGNGTSLFTASGWAAHKFQNEIDVGQVGINMPIPVPVAYFSFTGSRASRLGPLGPNGKDGEHTAKNLIAAKTSTWDEYIKYVSKW